jgi:peptidoglycan/LPS O-acetylase OafA/YrhL
MHSVNADPNEFLFTVVCFGVGGSVLALVGIWLELRRGPQARRRFSGALCLLLMALAAVLWGAGQSPRLVAPLLALGAACLAAYGLQVAFVRRWASRLLEPWAVWSLLLIVCPIFAAVYAHHLSKPEDLPLFLTEPAPQQRKEASGPLAVTDLGREIELFHYDEVQTPEALEESLLEAERFTHEVIRIEGPNATSNCHGWVFTRGVFCVSSEQVDTILADNGYLPVERAQAGDLVIYRDDSGLPLHTGVVRLVGDDGLVLLESKWGPLGVFLHTPETQPYGSQFGFWRSPRLGHRLRFLSETPGAQ